MIINSASILSGQGTQQKYGVSRISGDRANRSTTRTIATPDGDTVQISPEARALFHAWSSTDTTASRPPEAGDGYRMQTEQNTPDNAEETTGNRISVQEQISQLEAEISGIEGEITTLEKLSETDELSAAVLVRKQARLQTLLAKLMGLVAKSSLLYQSA